MFRFQLLCFFFLTPDPRHPNLHSETGNPPEGWESAGQIKNPRSPLHLDSLLFGITKTKSSGMWFAIIIARKLTYVLPAGA